MPFYLRHTLPLLIVPLLAWCALILCAEPGYFEQFFNADLIFPYSLARDLGSGGSILNWSLPRAPFIVPDALFLIPALGLARLLGEFGSPEFIVRSAIWYALFQGVLTLLCLGVIAKRAFSLSNSATALVQLGVALSVVYEFTTLRETSLNTSMIFIPICHFGTFLLALFLLVEALKDKPKLSILLLATLFGSFSDTLFWTLWILPAVGSWFALSIFQREGEYAKRGILVLGAGLLGAALQYLVYNRFIHVAPAPPPLAGTIINRSLVGLEWLMRDFAMHPHLLLLLCIAAAGALSGLLALRSDSTKQRFLTLFYVLMLSGGLLAPLVTGIYRPGAQRYIVPSLLLGVVVCLAPLFSSHQRIWQSRVTALIAVVALVLIAYLPRRTEALILKSFTPSLTLCLDRERSKLGDGFGAADYWNARRISLFTQTKLQVSPLSPSAEPETFMYAQGEVDNFRTRAVNFVVMDRLRPKAVRKKLGRPTSKFYCGRRSLVWVFSQGPHLRLPKRLQRHEKNQNAE